MGSAPKTARDSQKNRCRTAAGRFPERARRGQPKSKVRLKGAGLNGGVVRSRSGFLLSAPGPASSSDSQPSLALARFGNSIGLRPSPRFGSREKPVATNHLALPGLPSPPGLSVNAISSQSGNCYSPAATELAGPLSRLARCGLPQSCLQRVRKRNCELRIRVSVRRRLSRVVTSRCCWSGPKSNL